MFESIANPYDEENETNNILGGPRDVGGDRDKAESSAPMSMADVCRENNRLRCSMVEKSTRFFVARDRLEEARRLLRLAVTGLEAVRSPEYDAYLSYEIRKFLETASV